MRITKRRKRTMASNTRKSKQGMFSGGNVIVPIVSVVCSNLFASQNFFKSSIVSQFRKVQLSFLLSGPNCPLATITSIKELINDQLHHSSDVESNRSMLLFGITTSALIKMLFKLALARQNDIFLAKLYQSHMR